MSARANFLRSFIAKNIRLLESDGGPASKAPEGMLAITPFLGGDYYFLRHEIGWKPFEYTGSNFEEIKVPRGFVTDLASIPWILWSFLPRDGAYVQPAVVHDYQYWLQRWPKTTADRIFFLGMRELKVPFWKATVIYYSVAWLGGKAWRKNISLKINGEKRILREFPRSNITWKEWKVRPNAFFD